MNIKLSIPPGIISDDTDYASEGRWTNGKNIRFRFGKPEPIGATASISTMAGGIVRAIKPYTNAAGDTKAVIASGSQLYVQKYNGTFSQTSISPATGTDTFKMVDMYGDRIMALRTNGSIWTTADAASPSAVTEITQAPDKITSILVTEERQVLAFGCNEEISGVFNSMCIRGSDIEDYTDWTTSPANNAFEHILEGDGRIVTARRIGPYIGVWTTTGVYLGQFIGDPGQTYRWDLVAEGCGCFPVPNPQYDGNVAVWNSTAYWLGPGRQFWRWTPGGVPEPIPFPMRMEFMAESSLNDFNYPTITCPVPQFDEVWFLYPDTSETKFFSFNVREGHWSKGGFGLFYTAMIQSGVLEAVGTIGYSNLLAGTSSGITARLIQQEVNSVFADRYEWFVESGDIAIGNADKCMRVNRVIPDFEQQNGDVSLTIFAKDHPQAIAVEKGPYVLPPGTKKKDIRVDARLVAIKFAGAGGPGNFARIGTPSFEVLQTGAR